MEKELKNIPLLVSLSDAERKELVKYFAREGSYATGESLMISGGQESDVFFLLKGKVRISLSSTHGDLISYREIMPYDYFGWLSALDGAARLTSAVALEDSTALKVTAKDFKTILLAHPAIHDNFMLRLAGVVREYTERIHGLTALSARQRILGALMRRFVDYQTPIDIGIAGKARPRPGDGVLNHPGSDGVKMHVSRHIPEVTFVFH